VREPEAGEGMREERWGSFSREKPILIFVARHTEKIKIKIKLTDHHFFPPQERENHILLCWILRLSTVIVVRFPPPLYFKSRKC